MPNIIHDPIDLRRPDFNYVSPPICEAFFSSTGAPVLVLDSVARHPSPSGLKIEMNVLSWDADPDALCFTVYQSGGPDGTFVIIEECIQGNQLDVIPGCYRVSAITRDGETDLSEPVCF